MRLTAPSLRHRPPRQQENTQGAWSNETCSHTHAFPLPIMRANTIAASILNPLLILLPWWILSSHSDVRDLTLIAKASQKKSEILEVIPLLESRYPSKATWDYCWMNGQYFQNLNRTLSDETHQLIVTRFKDTINAGEVVIWHIHIEDKESRRPVLDGGTVVRVQIQGPSLHRPKVFDLRNGTYLVAFQLYDVGSYAARLSLRWTACRAYVFCSHEDIHQPVLFTTTLLLDVVKPINPVVEAPVWNTGRWVRQDNASRLDVHPHPLLDGPYIWKPWHGSLENFPVEKLKDKWLYFIGDSLTRNSFQQLTREILPQDRVTYSYIRRDNGSIMLEDDPGISMEILHYPDMNLVVTYTWYPDYPDLWPVGGTENTRYPLLDKQDRVNINNIDFKLASWLEHFRAYTSKNEATTTFLHPSAVVVNFGLHFAAQFDPLIYKMIVQNMLTQLRSAFSSRQTLLVWRDTAYTHFDDAQLPQGWDCRTPERVQIMNEVAMEVTAALGIPTIDFAEVSATRSDVVPDNRHYPYGNVRATYNNILLNFLNDKF